MNLKFIFPIGSVLFIGALTAFSSDTMITEDKTASGGDWEVIVESGDTCFVTAAQTGTGAIVKKGAGSLVLSGDNTFSGGVVVDEGTVEPHHSNAFGTGKITLNADGEKECRVAFTKGELTFTNDLELVGTSAIDKPAFYFHSATNVWNGKITAPTGDFYMCDNGDWCYISTGGKYENGSFTGSSWSTKVSKIPFMTFNGDITVHGIVYLVPDGLMTINGSVTCDTLDTCYRKGLFTLHTGVDSSFYAIIAFNGINHVRQFNAAYAQRQFVGGGLEGTIVHWPENMSHSEGPGNVFFSNAKPSRIAGFTSVFPRKYPKSGYGNIHGTSKANVDRPRIVLTGEGATGENPTFACHSRLGGHQEANKYFDLAVDGTGVNPGFTQVFSNRHHVVQGILAATNGTLRFVGESSCSNVMELAIGANGRIEDLTTFKGSFLMVKKISVASTGKLKLANAFTETFLSDLTSLELETGAVVEAPAADGGEEIRVTSLKIGGASKQMGTYAASELSGVTLPAGFKITVVEAAPATAVAVWTGAAEADDLMTTLGNWKDAVALPDLTAGFTKVELAGGTAMTPGEGRTFLHSIENTITCTTDDDAQKPIVVGAAGKTVEVAGSVISDRKAQLVLRGTIAPPDGVVDESEPAVKGVSTLYHRAMNLKNQTWPTEYLQGYYEYSVPLVLDGAVIAKPVYSDAGDGGAGACHLRTLANTENRISGNVYLTASGWTELTLDTGSTLEFAGGVRSAARNAIFGGGTLKISGKPWTDGNGLTMEGGAGKIVLDVEGNWFGNCSVGYGLDLKAGGGTIEFKRSYCFVDGHQMAVRNNSKCVVEFNCTTQRVAQLGAASSHRESVIHGDYGSMLEIMGGCRKETMTEGFAGMACSMQITGGLGIHMMGTGKGNKSGTVKDGANDMYLLQGSRDFQSCGNLEVSGGQLSLTLGNTWKNGTNFIMRGTGQLRLAGTEQLSRDFARLHFSDEGNLYLGGVQHVQSAELFKDGDWVEVPKGWYSATQPGILAGRISGNGRIRIGEKGAMMILR